MPISRLCTFPPAHWRLILLIHYFNLVIGGRLHSKYFGSSLLAANYSRKIQFFLYCRSGCRQKCSLNIPNNFLYFASYYTCRKIPSHWQPLFSKKMATADRFSYKISGGSKYLVTLLAAVLTWSGYRALCSAPSLTQKSRCNTIVLYCLIPNFRHEWHIKTYCYALKNKQRINKLSTNVYVICKYVVNK